MVLVKDFIHAQALLEGFISYEKAAPRYTLDRMRSLMAYLGNPQDTLKTIHVAGTSGKTSTAYYVAALLVERGFTVGLGVSPYVDSIAERAQVNLQLLPEDIYCRELGEYLELVAQSSIMPSYFEVLVGFTFWVFKRQKVDYAVIEVGLGGLLDTTNVITCEDKMCIITDIGYDHVEILGNTIEEIAAQKAGIIQNNNQVFMHSQRPEVMQVVKAKTDEAHANLTVIGIDEIIVDLPHFHELPLFQQRNFSLAYGAVKSIVPYIDPESAMAVYVPGRMEVVQWHAKTVILDGSHNEQKVSALVESVNEKYTHQSVILLVSFGKNKISSVEAVLESLRGVSARIILTRFDFEEHSVRRSIDTATIQPLARAHGFDVECIDNPKDAFEYALSQPEEIVLVTGSFYLLNYIRPIVAAALHTS